jgi:uncharacterized caspase-like protein
MASRIILALIVLSAVFPSSLPAAAERRTALIIGNSAYGSGPLKNPVNDATDMAATLKKAGFTVTLRKNANLREMIESIEEFGNTLKRGGVGLFYYAGHGVQVGGVNYLLPIGARINKEGDVRYEAVDAGRVLTEMETANNGLNIVILDACRDNPFGRSVRSSSRGLAIVTNAPTGTFISYSTGAGQVAKDGTGRNSPYTKALLENISKPGLTINEVFMSVRSKVKRETGQVPWELSSLEGNFFFIPGKGAVAKVKDDASSSAPAATDALDEENRKLEAERQRLEQEEAALAKQKALDEKRRQIEEKKERLEAEKEAQRQAELERKQAKKKGTTVLAMARPPAVSSANETGRDGRFIAYDNGTVLDSRTNLMWAAKDNGSNINWANAKSYCENYQGGGYTDWRMPTQDELAGLYDAGITSKNPPTDGCGGKYHLTELIHLTCCCPWASETRGSGAANFTFNNGIRYWNPQSNDYTLRALPVRSTVVKKDNRFKDNRNGTVTDTKTGLMWAAKDNGSSINWANAKSYCENYRGGGYTDWRMPTQDELAGLYDSSVTQLNEANPQKPLHLTDLINVTSCCPWANDVRGAEAASFNFIYGIRIWSDHSHPFSIIINRTLPVRAGK